jgi:hypothetical protein
MATDCLWIRRSIQLAPELSTQKNEYIGNSVHQLRILTLQSVTVLEAGVA